MTDRIETGPLQIDGDWPGLFIRGDTCAGLRLNLESIVSAIESGVHPPTLDLMALKSFVRVLRSVNGCDDPTCP